MEYGLLAALICLGAAAYWEISSLKKRVKAQQLQIDALCKSTGNGALSAYFVSEEAQKEALRLKNSGKPAEAVKVIRRASAMDLLQAKQYVDQV